jgi:hypothetical protein
MGFCKYCGNEYDPNKKKHLNEIFLNDKMEKYIMDSKGNKYIVLTDSRGLMYYIDANGDK